jgi:hypothetical protein
MDVLPETACAMPTTNLQPKPTAEPKTAVSTNKTGRRSSRDWLHFFF